MMWNAAVESEKAVVSTPPPMMICASSSRRFCVLSESGSLEATISWKMVFFASLDLMSSP